ncbi:MAG: hypothetical protein AB1782_15930 [Cyanobacteriota bacterium]
MKTKKIILAVLIVVFAIFALFLTNILYEKSSKKELKDLLEITEKTQIELFDMVTYCKLSEMGKIEQTYFYEIYKENGKYKQKKVNLDPKHPKEQYDLLFEDFKDEAISLKKEMGQIKFENQLETNIQTLFEQLNELIKIKDKIDQDKVELSEEEVDLQYHDMCLLIDKAYKHSIILRNNINESLGVNEISEIIIIEEEQK